MRKSLLVGGVLAFGQECFLQPLDNCTQSGLNCAIYQPFCYRNYAFGACNTSSSTCGSENTCVDGPQVTDTKTCSTCTDNCRSFTSNETCVANAACSWILPFCYSQSPPPAPPCAAATTKSACVSEDNCFWVSATSTTCGRAPQNVQWCLPCNSSIATLPPAWRSALKNTQGQTCTWSAVAPFISDFSVDIIDVEQSASFCDAFAAPDSQADRATLSNLAAQGMFTMGVQPVDAGSSAVCTGSSGSQAPSSAAGSQAPTSAAGSQAPTSATGSQAPTTAPPQAPVACFLQSLDNCTQQGCTLYPSFCYRNYASGVCNTSSSTCGSDNTCVDGPRVTDAKTCSTCTDNCRSFTSNDTCVANAACSWLMPFCYQTPSDPPPIPCAATTKSACIAEDNCFWMSTTSTTCGGAPQNVQWCLPCNSTLSSITPAWRSALKNNQGQTCTWSAAAPFVSDFSVDIIDIAQSASTCNAFTAPNSQADRAALSTLAAQGVFSMGLPTISASSPPAVCTGSAVSQAPSSAGGSQAPSSAGGSQAPSSAGGSQAPSSSAPPSLSTRQTTEPTAELSGALSSFLWSPALLCWLYVAQ